jgi:hypothetical protein
LNKDEKRQPFTDMKIVSAKEENLKYVVMTNIEINVYEQNKVVQTIENPGNLTYVFVDYDTAKDYVVIGSVNDTATIVDVYPADRSLNSFTFGFDPRNDILLKTSHNVLVIKLPREGQRLMIVGHKPVGREMLFNDIAREVGTEFQVFVLVKA